jgi:hypothetical protein
MNLRPMGILILALYCQAQSPVPIFGTGVASDKFLLADGANDLHYTVGGAPAVVVNSIGFPFPFWKGSGASKWIAPSADQSVGIAPGPYVYTTTFDLTGFDLPTVTISGEFSADNSATVSLNGTALSAVSQSFASTTPFAIKSGFLAGVNTLVFTVTNDGESPNPTGLLVNLSGTGTLTGSTPPITPSSVWAWVANSPPSMPIKERVLWVQTKAQALILTSGSKTLVVLTKGKSRVSDGWCRFTVELVEGGTSLTITEIDGDKRTVTL